MIGCMIAFGLRAHILTWSLLTWSMVCHSFDFICIPSKMVDGAQQHFFLELEHMVYATQNHLLCSDLSM